MLNTSGLSLQQAPPISVPLRFFLTAPLFGVMAGIVLLLYGETLLISRWLPSALVATHFITLGFLAMAMCGAMFQMLPVIVGSPVPNVVLVGWMTHILVSLGTLLLALAFWDGGAFFSLAATICLGCGFTVFATAATISLVRVKQLSATGRGMRLAVAALVVTVFIGILAALAYSGIEVPGTLQWLANIHLTWGLVGWVGLLLMSVSFQLIPMFLVTPDYPGWLMRWVPGGLFIAISVYMVLRLPGVERYNLDVYAAIVLSAGMLSLGLFALSTLGLQHRRKRRIVDATLLFWRSGMVGLVLCVLLWVAGRLFPSLAALPAYSSLLGVGIVLGVGFPLVNGMLYKIVPFLCWFHLQNRQLAMMCLTVNIPHMKAFISERFSRQQLYSYWVMLGLAVLAIGYPEWFASPAGLLLILTNLLLLRNVAAAVRLFRVTFEALSAESESSKILRSP